MTRKGQISRQRIIEASNRLVYTQGYNQTSFSDIASAVGITKGNLHYHFKSKEDLLAAIIEQRKVSIRQNLEQWDHQFPDVKDRLKRFAKMLLNEQLDIVRYGCPLGSLNVELGKCQVSLQENAREMFDLLQSWLEKCFLKLERRGAKSRSKHMLAMMQGASLMAYVYSDDGLINDEYQAIVNWIDSLS